jgi:TRAP-type C4-dicarboxylate transport system substrate-binding protein
VNASLAVALVLASLSAQAQETIRMATMAPDGTGWAREIAAFNHDVATRTNGQVIMKWYLGGIAGDEYAALERVRRGQLDGEAGTLFCDELAPSLRVTRVLGLIQNRDEGLFLLGKLRSEIDDEFARSGFVHLGAAAFGSDVLFSRTPVHDLIDLRRGHYWVRPLDSVLNALLRAIGVKTVQLPYDEVARAYDKGQIDGVFAPPITALAFQWSSRMHYLVNLRVSFLPVCMVVAAKAFNRLKFEHQQALRAAVAKLRARLNDLGKQQDELLLGGALARQGLVNDPVSEPFRAEFLEAARVARAKVANLLAPGLLDRALIMLADFRAARPQPAP